MVVYVGPSGQVRGPPASSTKRAEASGEEGEPEGLGFRVYGLGFSGLGFLGFRV